MAEEISNGHLSPGRMLRSPTNTSKAFVFQLRHKSVYCAHSVSLMAVADEDVVFLRCPETCGKFNYDHHLPLLYILGGTVSNSL